MAKYSNLLPYTFINVTPNDTSVTIDRKVNAFVNRILKTQKSLLVGKTLVVSYEEIKTFPPCAAFSTRYKLSATLRDSVNSKGDLVVTVRSDTVAYVYEGREYHDGTELPLLWHLQGLKTVSAYNAPLSAQALANILSNFNTRKARSNIKYVPVIQETQPKHYRGKNMDMNNLSLVYTIPLTCSTVEEVDEHIATLLNRIKTHRPELIEGHHLLDIYFHKHFGLAEIRLTAEFQITKKSLRSIVNQYTFFDDSTVYLELFNAPVNTYEEFQVLLMLKGEKIKQHIEQKDLDTTLAKSKLLMDILVMKEFIKKNGINK